MRDWSGFITICDGCRFYYSADWAFYGFCLNPDVAKSKPDPCMWSCDGFVKRDLRWSNECRDS